MTTDDPIEMIVLQEFRLRVADSDGAVARLVASSQPVGPDAIPLLTSIADHRDVATIRAQRASDPPNTDERAALGGFVARWDEPKHYLPRIAEGAQSPTAHYRLAVTESGINDTGPPDRAERATPGDGTAVPLGLIWIGRPVGSYAGLLVLLGHARDVDRAGRTAGQWPLSLSADLGVRIYEGPSY